MIRQILFVLIFAFTLPATGQVYSWKDESGRIHYTDTPPPGIEAKAVKGTGATPAAQSTASPQKSTAEIELEFRQRREAAAEAEAKAAREKEKEDAQMEACAQARDHLSALESGQRMRRMDSKTGEMSYVDDAARTAEVDRLKKQISELCK